MVLTVIYYFTQVSLSTTEAALALNRYICSAVFPLLKRCAPLFSGTEHHASLVDSMLHTIYRLSKGRSLTKAQRDTIEECLLAICQYVLYPVYNLFLLCSVCILGISFFVYKVELKLFYSCVK